MIKSGVIFVLGVIITLLGIDYKNLKNKVQIINTTSYRCSQALFDDNEDWNEYSLHICQTLHELDDRLGRLEDIKGAGN